VISHRHVTLLGGSVSIFHLPSCCGALCHVLQDVQQLTVEPAYRIYKPGHTLYSDWLCYAIWLKMC